MRFLLISVLACLPALAAAQPWPSKPIRYIIPFPPGGSSDLMSRAIAPRLGERLGQPIVIENKPGAGGMLGVDQVAKAAPDGYTIGLAAAGALSSNISLYPKMPFHPEKDLVHITPLAMVPFFLVAHPSQAGSVRELIAAVKAKPDALQYGQGGNGSTMHLAGELFNMMAGLKIQSVPFKGSGPVSAAVLGNQIPIGMVDVTSAISNVRAGRLKALAVTSKQRISAAPDVPTFEEAGVPGYEAVGWFGVVGPAGMPADIVQRLNQEIAAALKLPEIRKIAVDAGNEPFSASPQEFSAMIRAETVKWADVIKAGNIRID
jgi:tripartite-type tricarboxylate transporter receptor subunit TctC